ncbi:DUF6249 domain-containing protein [Segatella oris]|uniref:DUF6249 domain-containing protein n=1 Tax=Segatella oris TaxID=28135 RepID=UPI0036210A56
MKQTFITLLLVLTLGTNTEALAQRHRHTPRVEAVSQKTKASDRSHKAAAEKAKNGGIEAFSDTTSSADDTVDTAVVDTTYTSGYHVQEDDFNESPWFVKAITGALGVGAVIFALLIVVLVFLFLVSPFIIIILVLRYLIRRHNDNVRLAEKAMESGQAVPSGAKIAKHRTYSNEDQWQRGIKTVSIGLGLMALFWFIGAEQLVGVGVLILCMGAGQMLIGRTSRRNESPIYEEFEDEKQDSYEEESTENKTQDTDNHPQA